MQLVDLGTVVAVLRLLWRAAPAPASPQSGVDLTLASLKQILETKR